MTLRIFSLIYIFILSVDNIHTVSSMYKINILIKHKLCFFEFLVVQRGNEVFQLVKDAKERVKHGTRMFSLIYIKKRKKNIDFRMYYTIEILCWFMLYIYEIFTSYIMGKSV
jgi:hypothetical protein